MKVTITIETDDLAELARVLGQIAPSDGSQPAEQAITLDAAHGPFTCPECGAALNTVNGLKIHRAKMHEDAIKAALGVICPECGREFANKAGLATHRARPHKAEPEKPLGCAFCGRKFDSEVGRSIHQSTMHSGDVARAKAAISPAKTDPIVLRREKLLADNRRYMGKTV